MFKKLEIKIACMIALMVHSGCRALAVVCEFHLSYF